MGGHIYNYTHAQKRKLLLQIRTLHVIFKFNYGLSQHNNVNDSVIKNTHETVCKVINLVKKSTVALLTMRMQVSSLIICILTNTPSVMVSTLLHF